MDKKSFILFCDYEDLLADLSDADLGLLLRGIFAYTGRGEEPIFESGELKMAFRFIRRRLDADRKAYQEKCEKRRQAGAKGGKSKAENLAKQANASVAKQDLSNLADNDTDNDTDTDTDTDIIYPPIVPQGTVAQRHKEKQERHKYGEYGWVQLTEEEYTRLLADLGEKELSRCIAYVDESAQSTGNKNKWRDWNLVIRKCARGGWGKGGSGKAAAVPQAPPSYDLSEFERMMQQHTPKV